VANFPDSPGIGSVFIDSTSGFAYKWTGVVWKSFLSASGTEQKVIDDISSSFDNSTATFDLAVGGTAFFPKNAQSLQVSLGGVIQEPVTDYTIDDSSITFTTAPNAGLDFFAVSRTTAVNLDFANDGNVSTKQQFTATEAQTTFTVTGGYTVDNLDVYRNGVRLRSSTDFTATNGTTFVLTAPASTGDLLESVAYKVASVVVTTGNFTNLNLTGIATVGVLTGATSVQSTTYYGDGSNLTGIDATSLKDSGGNVKAQANVGGVVITGVATATTFKGDLTGDVTGNADTATVATNAQGLTGTPNISIGSLTAASGSVSGNLTVGGTITYQDATNMDVLGISTFQQGIQVLANGANITGIVTVGVTTIKSGEIEVVGVVTATTFVGELNSATLDTVDGGVIVTGIATATGYKVGTAISITDDAISATRFHGSGANLTGIESWNQFDTWLYAP
jgi:hypothetical protein